MIFKSEYPKYPDDFIVEWRGETPVYINKDVIVKVKNIA